MQFLSEKIVHELLLKYDVSFNFVIAQIMKNTNISGR